MSVEHVDGLLERAQERLEGSASTVVVALVDEGSIMPSAWAANHLGGETVPGALGSERCNWMRDGAFEDDGLNGVDAELLIEALGVAHEGNVDE